MAANVVEALRRAESVTHVPYLNDDERALWAAQEADAAVMVRRLTNRHGCTRQTVQDPPCTHPQHADDVALCRLARAALDLAPEATPTATGVSTITRPRGTCHECGRRGVKLLTTGALRGALTVHSRNHSTQSYERCKGSQHLPRKATT